MVQKSLASFVDGKSAAKIRLQAEEIESQLQSDKEISADQTKKLEKRARRMRRQADEVEVQQETQLNLSLAGLEELNYIDSKGLTEKGAWAAELCTSLVLQLAEMIEEGLLYDLPAIELTALIGSIAGDAHRTYFSLAQNPLPKERYTELAEIIDRVRMKYKGPSTATETKVIPHGALTVTTWMCSDNWTNFSSLLKLAGVAEGDAARLITQTADHLGQIGRLQESHPGLARTALEARDALLRPPLSDSMIIS
jgi:superfamily II RNA helicase